MHGNISAARKAGRRGFWRTFAIPTAIGTVSMIGLIAALIGDGFLDAVSWGALAIPLAVILWAFARRG